MLYPNIKDLIVLKARKSALKHSSFRLVKSTVHGNHHSPFRGQGLEFDAVREYVSGDDIRSIDWRVTARTGSPHMKIFKEDRERHIGICIDMNSTMRFGTKNTFKSVQAAHVAAFLGWQGLWGYDRISACLFGDVKDGMQFFGPKRTPKSFCSILKILSEPHSEQHHILFDDVLPQINQSAHTGSLVYIISDFMAISPDFKNEGSLSRLSKKCDVVFIAINDPADKSLYPFGALGFSSKGDDKICINTKSSIGRESYASQWIDNRRRLYEMTSRMRIPIIELSTESDICRDLTIGLKMIAKRKQR